MNMSSAASIIPYIKTINAGNIVTNNLLRSRPLAINIYGHNYYFKYTFQAKAQTYIAIT